MADPTPPLPGFEPGARHRPKRVLSEPAKERKRERDRLRKRPPRTCPICGKQYHPTSGKQKTCSRECARTLCPTKPKSCLVYFSDCSICGRTFTARTARRGLCGDEDCRREAHRRRRNERYPELKPRVLRHSHARRARLAGVETEQVVPWRVYERDKWRCKIKPCLFGGKPVRRKARGKRDPLMASLDHVIPIAQGGTHTYGNVQCSHYRCNLSKSDGGGGEQLMLIG